MNEFYINMIDNIDNRIVLPDAGRQDGGQDDVSYVNINVMNTGESMNYPTHYERVAYQYD